MAHTFFAPTVKITLKVLGAYGVDTDALLKQFEIDPKKLNDPQARLPYALVDQLWKTGAEMIDDPALGLKAAEFWHPTQMGPLGYAWLSSNDLKSAMYRFKRYVRVLTEGADIEIEETPKTFTMILKHRPIATQQPVRVDAFMAIMFAMCQANFGRSFTPYEIRFKHAKPEDITPYQTLFQCPVVFGASENCFTITMADALKPLEGAHPQLAKLHDQVIIDYLAQIEQKDIVEQVKSEIIKQLPNGDVTDSTVGQALYLNERTLQRRLKEHGTTFKTLMDEVREDLASTYIQESNLSMSEISYLLGFGNISSFSRAFKRWTGTSPSQLRSSN